MDAERRNRDRPRVRGLLQIQTVVRLHHRVDHARDQVDEPAHAMRRVLGRRDPIADRNLRVRLDEQHSERRPVGNLFVLAIEEPHREVGEHPAVDNQVLAVRLAVLDADRLEEDRNRHAHPDGERHIELVRIHPELRRVPREHEQLSSGGVRCDHL